LNNPALLYYIHDPMCSWCWGFRKTWDTVLERLDNQLPVQYLLGGLAPDTQDPMPQEMQTWLRNTWLKIQQTIPGTGFNLDFWTTCQPRRSTYPACRAVIATRHQQPALEAAMILAIQEAYYLNASNPSDDETLIDLARGLGLDASQFARDLAAPEIQQELLSEIHLIRELGVRGFPSLVLKKNDTCTLLQLDYKDPDAIIRQIN
jgi:putative protein-disulfide isomerase